jgi:hypothetical protein
MTLKRWAWKKNSIIASCISFKPSVLHPHVTRVVPTSEESVPYQRDRQLVSLRTMKVFSLASLQVLTSLLPVRLPHS